MIFSFILNYFLYTVLLLSFFFLIYGRYTTTEPELNILPCDWETTCNQFQKMLIVRCLRADRITSCVRTFIIDILGKKVKKYYVRILKLI